MGRDSAVLPGKVAADPHRICSSPFKRPGIQSAGGHLGLIDAPVLFDKDLFRTPLPAEIGPVGLPVVEDIPLSAAALNASVGIPEGIDRFLSRAPVISDIPDINESPAKPVSPVGILAERVAQLAAFYRRIYEIIEPADLPDRACFKELMPFKSGPGAFRHTREQPPRLFFECQHIRLQPHDLGRLLPAILLRLYGSVP